MSESAVTTNNSSPIPVVAPSRRALTERERRNRRRGFKNQAAVEFHGRHDWKTMRFEFLNTLSSFGEFRWGTLADFVKEKFADPHERGYAHSVLGRRPLGWIPWEGDWETDRRDECLRSDERIRALVENLNAKASAAKIAASTAPLSLEMIARCVEWSRQLDRETHGQLMVPGRPLEENVKRAKQILRIVRVLTKILNQHTQQIINCKGGREALRMEIQQRVAAQEQSKSAQPLDPAVERAIALSWERIKQQDFTKSPNPEKA